MFSPINKLSFKKSLSLIMAFMITFLIIPFNETVYGAQMYFESDFDTDAAREKVLSLADGKTYPVTFEPGLGDKSMDDYAIYAKASDMSNAYGTCAFEFPYLRNVYMSTPTTFEISLFYGGDADMLRVYSSVTNGSIANGTKKLYTFLEVYGGEVYVFGKATGIKCNKDEWIHFASELQSDMSQTKVFVNNTMIETSPDEFRLNAVCWIQAQAVFNDSANSGRSGYIALDNIKIYRGTYASFSENGMSVSPMYTYVNGTNANEFSKVGDVLTAKISAYASEEKHSALILAIYRDGILEEISKDEKDFSGYGEFETNYTVTDMEALSVKAMFLESFSTIRPLSSAESYIPLTEVYYRNTFDNEAEVDLGATTNGNSFEWTQDGSGDAVNGFMRFTKNNSVEIYSQQSLGAVGKKVIVEADIRHGAVSAGPLDFITIDGVTAPSRIIQGPIVVYDTHLYGSGETAAIKKGDWNKISLALDFTTHTFDAYLNGEMVIEDKGFSNEMNTLSELRFQVEKGNSQGTVDIDNLVIYAGIEPREIGNTEIKYEYRFDAADMGKIYLSDKNAVHTYANTMFASGKKQKLSKACINYGDESLLPKDAFEALFKRKVTVSGNSISIAGGTSMTVGNNEMMHNGKSYTLSNAPEIKNGTVFIPALAYGENVFAESFYNDNHGLLMVGSGIDSDDKRLKDANLYMFFERKSGDALLTQLKANTNNLKSHPRLMITSEDVVRLRSEINTDPYKKKWFEKIKARADKLLNSAPVEYRLTNGRLHTLSFGILANLEAGAFTYLMTQDEKYAQRVKTEMEALLNFPDWGHPQSFLECSQIGTAFAIAFDWIHDYLDKETAQRFATTSQEMCVQLAKNVYQNNATFGDFFWNTETNWGVIANGGPANLILATAEYNDTDDLMEILAGSLRAMEYMWYRFAPDGAWHEGTGYWSYLLQFLSRFEACYSTAMGDYYAKDYCGLDKYGYFQCYFMGPDALPNNFGDADSYNVQSEGQFLLAKMYGDNELMRYRRLQMEKYDIEPTVEDIIWYDASLSGDESPVKLDRDKYFRETEFVALRENWEKEDSAWLSYHGGEMHSDHNHIDMGTFVFTLGGVRWALDTGKEPLRYDQNNPALELGYINKHYYRGRLEGHNSVVINPDSELELDMMADISKATAPVSNEYGAYGSIELSDAYKKNASSYKRGYMLTDSRRTAVIRDEFELIKNNSQIYWFMHTYGDIRIIDDKTAIIYDGGKALYVQLDASFDGELCIMDAVSLPSSPQFEMSPNEDVTKLCFKGTASGKNNITVKMALLGEIGSETGVDTTPISQWNVSMLKAGREYSYSTARLSSIKLDGVTISGFNKEKFSYTVKKTGTTLPKVTAKSSNGGISAETFKGLNGKDIRLLTVKGADGLTTYYTVAFD